MLWFSAHQLSEQEVRSSNLGEGGDFIFTLDIILFLYYEERVELKRNKDLKWSKKDDSPIGLPT